ncbi:MULTISPECIES: hypothetical protein [Caballeronia]|uniref:Uncharacterized protein n=3 Tax=Caballeronia TaxID=1827195 RepID=A0AA37ICJ7_9BURK|nr:MULTISPECIES: hypothetical protein [Caballeronia]MBC8635282.1 hypothetical protein [Caballeronia sp. EK]MDR5748569.1 hypothetical protein [Caballeronia sp. LZ029]GJH16517.1 hypothetical protein CBA19CS22_08265 [Caballeronia novacaledonica]GJH27441.1 hypothetical protein CBA19CS42_23015 [Caballeronia novacaledonica]
MIRFKHMVDAALEIGSRLQSLLCFTGLRYGSVVMTLPLLSSVCFFAFRFALSRLGVPV